MGHYTHQDAFDVVIDGLNVIRSKSKESYYFGAVCIIDFISFFMLSHLITNVLVAANCY
jgi:hypothetical protein